MTNFQIKYMLFLLAGWEIRNKKQNKKETCAEQPTNGINNCPKRNHRCSSLPPNKPLLFFFLKQEFPSYTHSPPFLPLSHYMHVSLVSPLPLLLPTLPAPPPHFFLLMFSFFLFFFAIMESPLSTCDSLFHQPKPDRKKSQMLVSPLCLSGSVCPLSVGEAAFLQGAPITPIGLPLSARLFPIEACVSQRPSSRFKQKLGG